jgi:hypothetical protein
MTVDEWAELPEDVEGELVRSLEIWELGADRRYVRARTATSGRVDRVPGCEGLVVDLDALWAEVDRLTAADVESD